jgi:hypothetical protein
LFNFNISVIKYVKDVRESVIKSEKLLSSPVFRKLPDLTGEFVTVRIIRKYILLFVLNELVELLKIRRSGGFTVL